VSPDLKNYKITQVTFTSSNHLDSTGAPFNGKTVDLKNKNWTLLLNNAYKLYTGDGQDVSIDTGNHPFNIFYDGTNWNMQNSEGSFTSVVLSDFQGHVLYPQQGQPHPGQGFWLVTFDYCKNGQCT
jgi:hypothetical protein